MIEPLLPASGVKGRPGVDDRRVVNGMLHKCKTGIAWRDLPDRYGPWKTVDNWFWRWLEDTPWRADGVGRRVETIREPRPLVLVAVLEHPGREVRCG